MGVLGTLSDFQGLLNAACNLQSDSRGEWAELKIFYSSTPSTQSSSNSHSARYILDKTFVNFFNLNAINVRPAG